VREELSGNTAGLKASHSKRLLATWPETVAQTWKVIPAARIELQRQQQAAEAEATAAD